MILSARARATGHALTVCPRHRRLGFAEGASQLFAKDLDEFFELTYWQRRAREVTYGASTCAKAMTALNPYSENDRQNIDFYAFLADFSIFCKSLTKKFSN